MSETVTISEPPILSGRSTVRLTTAQALVRYLAGLQSRKNRPASLFAKRVPPICAERKIRKSKEKKITFTTTRLTSGF